MSATEPAPSNSITSRAWSNPADADFLGPRFARYVNDQAWNDEDYDEEPGQDEEDETILTTCIARFLLEEAVFITDDILYDTYQDAFKNWTLRHFDIVHRQVKTKLKQVLKERGVYLSKKLPPGISLSQELFNLAQTQEYLNNWPVDELVQFRTLSADSQMWHTRENEMYRREKLEKNTQLAPGDENRSRLAGPGQTLAEDVTVDAQVEGDIARQVAEDAAATQSQSGPASRTVQSGGPAAQTVHPDTPVPSTETHDTPLPHQATPRHEAPTDQELAREQEAQEQLNRHRGRGNGPWAPLTTRRSSSRETILLRETPDRHVHFEVDSLYPQENREVTPQPMVPVVWDDYRHLPPREYTTEAPEYRKIKDFMTVFGPSMKKRYSGKLYNLLDDKMLGFFATCKIMEITPPQFRTVFPMILIDKADSYYNDFLLGNPSFRDVYLKLKQHFEQDVTKTLYHTDWASMKYSVAYEARQPHETAMDVLNNMLDKFSACQRALGQQYAGEELLKSQVKAAVMGHPEFEYALMKPSLTAEGFFNDLRSSLQTVRGRMQSSGLHNSFSFDTPPDDEIARMHYTDRNYRGGSHGGRGNVGSSSRGRGGSYQGGHGGSYRARTQTSDRFKYKGHDHRTNAQNWKGKCFVCGKEGHWAYSHTPEERAASRRTWFSEYGDDKDTASYLTYVNDYEGDELARYDYDETAPNDSHSHDQQMVAPIWMMDSN